MGFYGRGLGFWGLQWKRWPSHEKCFSGQVCITISVSASVTGKIYRQPATRIIWKNIRSLAELNSSGSLRVMDPGRYVHQQGWDNNSVNAVSYLFHITGWYTRNIGLMWLYSIFTGISSFKENERKLFASEVMDWICLPVPWLLVADLAYSLNGQALEGYPAVHEPDFR